MVIKINYTSSDVYVSTSVSPVYVVVNYSAVNNGGGGTVSSVGLTMPSAFSVANSPVTSSGTLAVTGAGTASQYIRGDGQLATLPSNGSGGSSIAYYLNGSVNQGTIGGSVYYEMNKTPIIGAGTDFSIAGNGLISQFITDVADPNRLQIPAGNWIFDMYMSASSPGGTPRFYVELLKYDGTTFTSIASSSANPEGITNGTTIDLYVTALAVPLTTLLATDRLALRVYIVNSAGGRTITMHTENSHLCEIITNFAGGVSALNGLTANTQYFATGTSGTDFVISSATDTHTFNLPTASGTNRGALSSADWSTFSGKVGGSGASGQVAYWNGTSSQTGSNNLFWDNTNVKLGIGTNAPTSTLNVNGASTFNGTTIVSVNQNAPTFLTVRNQTTGTSAAPILNIVGANGNFQLSKANPSTTPYKMIAASDATIYNDANGDIGILNDNGSGKIKFAAGAVSTAQMTLTAAGRLLLGTTTESTFILDAVGDARFGASGGLTYVDSTGKITLNKGQNGITSLIVENRTAGTGSAAVIEINTNGPGALNLGKYSTTTSTYKIISSGDSYLGNFFIGDIAILNDVSTGKIKFAAGAVSTAQMTLTAAGRLLLGTTTESTFLLDVNGTARVSGNVNIGDRLTVFTSISNAYGLMSLNSNGISLDSSTDFVLTQSNTTTGGHRFIINQGGILKDVFKIFRSTNVLIQNGGTFTDTPSSQLTVESTTKGFLPPRMTNAQRTAISSPAVGLIVYCTDMVEGLYVYKSTGWTFVI